MENVFLFKHATDLSERLQFILLTDLKNISNIETKEKLKHKIVHEVMESFKNLDIELTDRLMGGVN